MRNALPKSVVSVTLIALGLTGVSVVCHADEPETPLPPAPLPQTNPLHSTDPDVEEPESWEPNPSPNIPLPMQETGAVKPKPTPPGEKKDPSPERPAFSGNSAEKWLGEWARDLYVSGGASLSSRNYSVSGSSDAQELYRQQNNSYGFGTRQVGPFQQNWDITLQGKVFDAFTVNGRLTNSRQGNYFNQLFGFHYQRKGTTIDAGDVNASLPGNEFVTFSRTLRGLAYQRELGGGDRISLVGSMTQAVTRRGTFTGNGSRGPYPLNASSILEGSEEVRLNDQKLQNGKDYLIDYLLGNITFLDGTIVNPEDTVVYTYEAQNFNSTPGILGGVRYNMSLGGGTGVGVTYLQQKSTNGSSGVGSITQRFPVSENINENYQLASLIQPDTPIVVRYLNQVLVENVDYRLFRDLRYFRLLRTLPPDTAFDGTLSLSADYTPVRQSSIVGDRSVLGLDTSTKLNKNVNLNLQYGQSNGQDKTKNGSAYSLATTFRGEGRKGKKAGTYNGSFGWREVGQGFSTIDSVSSAFLRAEKGLRAAFNYSPNDYLSLTSNLTQSRLATQQSSTLTGSTSPNTKLVWNTNQAVNLGASLGMPRWPRIDFTHSQTDQKTPGTGTSGDSRSTFGSDRLSVNWQKGRWGLSTDLERTAAKGRSVFSNGFTNDLSNSTTGTLIGDTTTAVATSNTNDSSSNKARFRVSVTPAAWISLVGAVGLSRTSYGASSTAGESGSTSNARDTSLGISLPVNPERLVFTINLGESTNGRRVKTNKSIPGSQLDYSIADQRTRTTAFNVHYLPYDSLDLNVDVSQTLSLIPGYDNTRNTIYQLTATHLINPRWIRGEQASVTGSFNTQKVEYIGSQQGTSDNVNYTLALTAGPLQRGFLKKWTFTSSAQRMDVGSDISYGNDTGNGNIPGVSDSVAGNLTSYSQKQNLNILSLQADYPIRQSQSLSFQWQALDSHSPSADSSTNQYYTASNYLRTSARIVYSMQLNDFMSLSFDGNLIQLTDREQPRLSYRAKSFNMDISARF